MSLAPINRHIGETVYSQIARSLEDDIQRFYKAGDFLPSEQELAIRFGVNRHTVRRAIALGFCLMYPTQNFNG